MRGCDRLKVRVASSSHFDIRTEGRYSVEDKGDLRRFIPECEDRDRIIVDHIRIGIDFHWQQEVTMLLPGIVEVVRYPDDSADLFNILPLDTYLTSVISSEMSADAPLEFLKAHAIVSRSWVWGKMRHAHMDSQEGKVFSPREIVTWEDTADHEGFDVCADDHCQRYQGVERVNETVSRAVAGTSGIILADPDGNPVDARFSKCCGGRTELFSTCWQPVDYSYLVSKEDPYCNPSRLSRIEREKVLDAVLMKYDRNTTDYYSWTHRVTKEEIRQSMKRRHGIDTGTVSAVSADRRGPSGRVFRLRIDAEKGTFYVGKELEIRRLLSPSCLYSSAFGISRDGQDAFLIQGRGWGHGVGLCQIGAAVMAAEGASCEDILRFYYPDTILYKPD